MGYQAHLLSLGASRCFSFGQNDTTPTYTNCEDTEAQESPGCLCLVSGKTVVTHGASVTLNPSGHIWGGPMGTRVHEGPGQILNSRQVPAVPPCFSGS